jgi:LAO/AO transport system kinase
MKAVSVEQLIAGVRANNRLALARAITQIENETPAAEALLSALYPHTGQAYLIGVTGAPGTGKSTLVSALAKHLRKLGKTVGIVAVDPTSPFSHGAILGDRIRMNELTGDPGVFIRSMASRGNLGGLARATSDVVRVMDAAGFDYILIETVGAGQSEVSIASTAHTSLVVDAPGLGDDIQATKAGILEIADVLVVNKADRPEADNTVRALKAMLDLGHRMQTVIHHGSLMLQNDGGSPPPLDFWQVPVIKTIATSSLGIAEVYAAIQNHRDHLQQSGQGRERERARLENELLDRLQEELLKHLLGRTAAQRLQTMLDHLVERQLTPAQAVQNLMNGFG